jgi:hypothetical protein
VPSSSGIRSPAPSTRRSNTRNATRTQAERRYRTRANLVRALGREVGVTAAHELGHQGGLSFTEHKGGLDNYDGFYDIPLNGPYDVRYWVYYLGRMTWSDYAARKIKIKIRRVD